MNKYGARKTAADGMLFASAKEARRYRQLKLLQQAGMIRDLQCQVKFNLIPKQLGERACDYIADFVYIDTATGNRIVEDTKGYRTDAYIIKRKLMLWVHGIHITEI